MPRGGPRVGAGRPNKQTIEAVRTLLPAAMRTYAKILEGWKNDSVGAMSVKARVAQDVISKFIPTMADIDLTGDATVNHGEDVLKLLENITARIVRPPEPDPAVTTTAVPIHQEPDLPTTN